MKHVFYLTAIAFTFFSNSAKSQTNSGYSLAFNSQKFETQTLTLDGKTFKVRAYENIVYVAKPVDINYQKMNIYIPEEYFEGKSINGYTVATAPIFFPNKIGGYMPSVPATALPLKRGDFPVGDMPPPGGFIPLNGDKIPNNAPNGGGMPPPMGGGGSVGFGGNQKSAVLVALSKGYVVASAGARGRTTKDQNGIYTGKAPAVLVDLKAAIRYLKFNDKVMPGDANKIISNGTSAGGALSTLVGATGNNPDYEPYLKALGAAKGTDDIFAVSAYCPITNLDYADMAYEWQFHGYNTYAQGGPFRQQNAAPSQLSDAQIKVSDDLSALFPAYVNSLHLKDKNGKELILNNDGNGSFKEYLKSFVIASAQIALDTGKNLSGLSWITIENGKVKDLDFAGYLKYIQRQKTPPAFDALDLSSPETNEFGTATMNSQHFTDYGFANSTKVGSRADASIVKMMNPMYYIGAPKTTTAKHWRIRHGAKDKDTGLAVSFILAILLENKGYDANVAYPWDRPHSGDYDLDELFAWTDSICK